MLRTIRALVDHQAEQRPDATYLVAPEPGLTMSFGELREASRRLASYLQAEGIRPGARVALLMHNGYQTCRLFIGAMYGGYCVTPLNLLAQPRQLAYVLEHSDAEIVFVAPDQVERLQQAASGWRGRRAWWFARVDAAEFLPSVVGTAIPDAPGEEDAALMMYTSGTTGKPKGVVLAQRAVVSGGAFVSSVHELGPADRVMAVLPLYHINAQVVTATSPLIHGGSLVLPHRFSASTFWQTAIGQGCTWINVVPTMIAYLLNGPDTGDARPRCLGHPFLPLGLGATAAFPAPGFREASSASASSKPWASLRPRRPAFLESAGTGAAQAGQPGPGLRQRGEDHRQQAAPTLAPGEVGEIMVRGDNVMSCYYKDPVETGRTLWSRRLAAHRRPGLPR
jgi:acyl-CoA synthetase (AMP-forming)/AMP-acid ligase II